MSSSSIIFCRWWTRQTELKSDSTGFKHRKWVCRKMQCTPISPSPLVEKNIFPMKWPWFQVPPIFRYPLADRLAPQWNHLAPAAHDASMMFLAPSAVSYKGVEKSSGSQIYMPCLTSPWGAIRLVVWPRFHTCKTCRPAAFPTFCHRHGARVSSAEWKLLPLSGGLLRGKWCL